MVADNPAFKIPSTECHAALLHEGGVFRCNHGPKQHNHNMCVACNYYFGVEGHTSPSSPFAYHEFANESVTYVITNEGKLSEKRDTSRMPQGLFATKGKAVAAASSIELVKPYFDKKIMPTRTVEVELKDSEGRDVIAKRRVTVPASWSDRAALIMTSKYLQDSESSSDELFTRVVHTISDWGEKDSYFSDKNEKAIFERELFTILETQRASFNSPVYFNVGINSPPQCSACFILKVEDDMESILTWYRNEGMIFKNGSGAGLNVSNLRSSRERLSGRGTASGPLSFMRAADSSAGVIKSGGKTRRAAKMVIMNDDHPDLIDFIECKVHEERKMNALIAAGYSGGIDGEARMSVAFQNANNSVRVSDEYMNAVIAGKEWQTKFRTTGEPCETYKARDLFHRIAAAAHECGDPGLQFDGAIQKYHTCPRAGKINGSNPCSEYFHLDDTACNLASLRVTKFIDEDGNFLIEDFIHTVEVLTTAMDIIVGNAGYPTAEIAENARKYRELGVGYADMGAALMRLGMAYDSDEGRNYMASITSLLAGSVYRQSARIGTKLCAAEGLEVENMERVLKLHLASAHARHDRISEAGTEAWHYAVANVKRMRNTQGTVLAPTGTIAFLMDCDTTGIEPAIALSSEKELVGGGTLFMTNESVSPALKRLGYSDGQRQNILSYIKSEGTIEGCKNFDAKHLPIFDCAFKARNGKRSISPLAHLRALEAVQPFISGGVSKTVNVPADTTVEQIEEFYLEAFRRGLKSISVYRDGSKKIQPLRVSNDKPALSPQEVGQKPARRKLPDERKSITHKFRVQGHKGYVTVGMYDDGTPGEIFIVMAKQGSTVAGFAESFATALSFGLQHGVPLEFFVRKFKHAQFEPHGFTSNADIPQASSIPDYIAKWLERTFLTEQIERREAIAALQPEIENLSDNKLKALIDKIDDGSGMACNRCGSIMVMQGSCWTCFKCGENSGC